MPAATTARSGFFETIASPLVRIAGSMVVVEIVADGTVNIVDGLEAATTIAATARAQLMAIAMGIAETRIPGTTTEPARR